MPRIKRTSLLTVSKRKEPVKEVYKGIVIHTTPTSEDYTVLKGAWVDNIDLRRHPFPLDGISGVFTWKEEPTGLVTHAVKALTGLEYDPEYLHANDSAIQSYSRSIGLHVHHRTTNVPVRLSAADIRTHHDTIYRRGVVAEVSDEEIEYEARRLLNERRTSKATLGGFNTIINVVFIILLLYFALIMYWMTY